jgi:hypothetical protein
MARPKKTTTVRIGAKKFKPDMRIAFDVKITMPDGRVIGISHDHSASSKNLKNMLKKGKVVKMLRSAADHLEKQDEATMTALLDALTG